MEKARRQARNYYSLNHYSSKPMASGSNTIPVGNRKIPNLCPVRELYPNSPAARSLLEGTRYVRHHHQPPQMSGFTSLSKGVIPAEFRPAVNSFIRELVKKTEQKNYSPTFQTPDQGLGDDSEMEWTESILPRYGGLVEDEIPQPGSC
ncbi:hypothetical protein SUGI_0650650 [Cryptomeria japonica]|nr:hypothetical protein SUGI_0650650 [Cryptomeria japonica]